MLDNFKIQIKKLGKRKVHTVSVAICKLPTTLGELVRICVESQVTEYNNKRITTELIKVLSIEQMFEQAKEGKIHQNYIYNDNLANVDKAIEVALQAFKDGLFAVFIDDVEIANLDDEIEINNNSKLTFIRMTFLTGRC